MDLVLRFLIRFFKFKITKIETLFTNNNPSNIWNLDHKKLLEPWKDLFKLTFQFTCKENDFSVPVQFIWFVGNIDGN